MCTGESAVVPAALRGYRTWDIHDGQLESLRSDYRWTFGEQAAQCRALACTCLFCNVGRERALEAGGHDVPAEACGCGLYGWYAPGDTRLMSGQVFGAIEVTGRVLMGTHGFRAERARVLGLALYGQGLSPKLIDACRDSLVPTFPSRLALIEALPPDDVSQLIDHRCGPECEVEMLSPFAAALAGGIRAAASSFASFGVTMSEISAIAALASAPSPAEVALEARRTRNTGPRWTRRAPRALNPRRTR
jgi:hypothetical protein